jgi:hypothetical protein
LCMAPLAQRLLIQMRREYERRSCHNKSQTPHSRLFQKIETAILN